MKVEPKRLRAFLLDSNLVSKKDFNKALKKAEKTGKDVDDVLVAEGLISEGKLAELKAYILGIPFVNLEKKDIPSETLKIIPEPIARRHNIIAFNKDGKKMEVAMLDPEDLRTI